MAKFELPPPVDDGRLIVDVGEWSKAKHHFLRNYMHAFVVAMKDKNWAGLNYIDLFAGPGVLRLDVSRRLEWGSPMIAAQMSGFTSLHLCEKKRKEFKALKERVQAIKIDAQLYFHNVNANSSISKIVDNIPPRSLSLAFLDPHGLHLDYSTVEAIARRRCDLIIYFPDRVDVLRNWELNYHDNPNSNLDRVLGPSTNWRSICETAPRTQLPELLRNLYVSQLKKLGYRFFEFERIYAKGLPIYQLIFCSEHKLGADIWRRVAKRKPDRQDTFDFGAPD